MEYLLPFDILAIDKKILLPRGTYLTDHVLDELIASNTTPPEMRSVDRHGSTIHDLEKLLRVPPYQILVQDSKIKDSLLQQIGATKLTIPVLQSLEYFRENDFYTYRHTLLVFVLTLLLARELLPESFQHATEMVAGPSHDIGKISVPLHILKKKNPLTKKERSILHHHALAGYVLLAYYLRDKNNIAAKVARDHHERRDCSGYPFGLAQKEPLVEIVIVADIYDALISPRPYRVSSFENRTALEHLTLMAREEKIGLDPLRALIALNRGDKQHYTEIIISQDKRGAPPSANNYDVETLDD